MVEPVRPDPASTQAVLEAPDRCRTSEQGGEVYPGETAQIPEPNVRVTDAIFPNGLQGALGEKGRVTREVHRETYVDPELLATVVAPPGVEREQLPDGRGIGLRLGGC